MESVAERRVRSMSEMQAEANRGEEWACKRCGCKHWNVQKTWDAKGVIRRKRICRNCGQDGITTTETPDER